MDFIELIGASGARYRFRRADPQGEHQPMAGAFVVASALEPLAIAHIGLSDNLAEVHAAPEAARGVVFTRLNVARASREAEHADLVAAYGAKAVRR